MGARGEPKTPGSGRVAGQPNRDTQSFRDRLHQLDFDAPAEAVMLFREARSQDDMTAAIAILGKILRHGWPTPRSVDLNITESAGYKPRRFSDFYADDSEAGVQ